MNEPANKENIPTTQDNDEILVRDLKISRAATRLARSKAARLQKENDVLKKENARLIRELSEKEATRLREIEERREEATQKEQEIEQAKAEKKRIRSAKRLKAEHKTFMKTCKSNAKQVFGYVSQAATALDTNSPDKATALVSAYVTLHSCPAGDNYTGYFQNMVNAYQNYFPLLLEGLRSTLLKELCDDVKKYDASTLTNTLNNAFPEENNDTISLSTTQEIIDAIVKVSHTVDKISGKYHHTMAHQCTVASKPPLFFVEFLMF